MDILREVATAFMLFLSAAIVVLAVTVLTRWALRLINGQTRSEPAGPGRWEFGEPEADPEAEARA